MSLDDQANRAFEPDDNRKADPHPGAIAADELLWFLVSGEEYANWDHPRVVELARASDPHGPAVGHLLLFREEDYMERSEEGWRYVGLLPLDLAPEDGDDGEGDGTEEEEEGELFLEFPERGEQAAVEAEELDPSLEDFLGREFVWPESAPCPLCPGEGTLAEDFFNDECAAYLCNDCETTVFAERREGILNAAPLFLLEERGTGRR